MGDKQHPCPRCGLVRGIRNGDEHKPCRDCKDADPVWVEAVKKGERAA